MFVHSSNEGLNYLLDPWLLADAVLIVCFLLYLSAVRGAFLWHSTYREDRGSAPG